MDNEALEKAGFKRTPMATKNRCPCKVMGDYDENTETHHPLCREGLSTDARKNIGDALRHEGRSSSPAPTISIEVFQQDWQPGFASFYDDGRLTEGASAHVTLNLGSLLCAVQTGDLDRRDLPYLIAETLMHETVHALEAWANVEFSEDRVEELLTRYRAKYDRATIWEYTGSEPESEGAPLPAPSPLTRTQRFEQLMHARGWMATKESQSDRYFDIHVQTAWLSFLAGCKFTEDESARAEVGDSVEKSVE